MIDNVYWDACVFYCLLTGKPPQHQADVLEILEDAKKGKVQIFTSTVSLAEVKPSAMKPGRSIDAFFRSLQGMVQLIDPNPNIMKAAGELRDAKSTNPGGGPARSIGLGDAIHLETCIYIRDVLGLKNIVFQTFDDGKGKNWEGRCVPLLSFENWFPMPRQPRVDLVCGLPRRIPKPNQSTLFTMGAIANVGQAIITHVGDQNKPS